jgi:hypothetical protein
MGDHLRGIVPGRLAGDRDGHARPVDGRYLGNASEREGAIATAANFDRSWPPRWRRRGCGHGRWDRKRQRLNRTAGNSGCWYNQWAWFAGWKIGYRCADRSALDGLEGHGNASQRSISNIVSWTVKLTGDASRNKPTNSWPRRSRPVRRIGLLRKDRYRWLSAGPLGSEEMSRSDIRIKVGSGRIRTGCLQGVMAASSSSFHGAEPYFYAPDGQEHLMSSRLRRWRTRLASSSGGA